MIGTHYTDLAMQPGEKPAVPPSPAFVLFEQVVFAVAGVAGPPMKFLMGLYVTAAMAGGVNAKARSTLLSCVIPSTPPPL